MPLSVAKPLFETSLDGSFKESRNKFKNQSKIAFKNAMIKFKEESAKAVKDGKVSGETGVFDAALEAASTVFMNEMDKAYGDTFESLGKKIASEVDKYVKQATIIVQPGQVVVTAGTPAAQTGSTTTPSAPALIT
jgi:hypothetical protein